jgi:hypothetical protein
MKNSLLTPARLGVLAFCVGITSGAIAQNQAPASPPVVSADSPATDPTASTTAMGQPAGTMSKGELKDQRQQQKRDEAAARANAKAAKAHASLLNADAKSKDANDKALQAQEKAGQVTAVPDSVPPPADSTSTPQPAPTAAPPQ